MIPAQSRVIPDMLRNALRHHQSGQLTQAEQLYRDILAVDAGHTQSLYLLALVIQQSGNHQTASQLLQQALSKDQNNTAYLFALGTAQQAQGNLPDAVACYRRVIALKPDYVEAHNNLGVTLAALGQVPEAVGHYQQALVLNPAHASAHNNLGNALVTLGRIDEAVAHYQLALAADPAHANAHNNLGNIRQNQGDYEAALRHFQQAIAIDPNHVGVLTNLGNIFKGRGEFDAALAHYGRAIALKPDYIEAHFHRSEIKVFRSGDPELAQLEALALKNAAASRQSPFIHFALAKALEDSGNYARAFEQMRQGNTIRRSQIRYDEPQVLSIFERMRNVFDAALLNHPAPSGNPSPLPIFVLGMPRSGSTLIELILASHPQVQALGELPDLTIAVRDVLTAGGRPVQYPECVPALPRQTLEQLGTAYLERLPALAEGKSRIVDKSLSNFFRIGLIRLILPNAKIIHCMRHPIDTCVSCYAHLFNSGLLFSYDLAELGRYYRRYSQLMAQWRTVLPPAALLDISYEDLLDDFEGQARRLIDYCELPWDDHCLSFHKTSREIRTASAVQVRQPLFRTSLQRWKKYEAHLAPLLNELNTL